MSKLLAKLNPYWVITICFSSISVLILCFFNGTGGNGDSIQHYLIARFAPQHPELYFNHWGKPVFTLLASPFAQFGFVGIKIFNALVSLGSLLLTCRVAKQLKLTTSFVAPVILVTSSLFLVLTYSGLTELLFALFLIGSVSLLLEKRLVLGVILISFLPFIRSEGLIILPVIAIYLLSIRQWRFFPLLLVGHVAYSIAGYFVYDDILWVITKIPYATLEGKYGGSNNLFHFIEQLQYVVGLPVYILFWLGILNSTLQLVTKKLTFNWLLLILGVTVTFIVAHSLFWYLGIFNSMGLKRVLVGVAPLIAIIALHGFNLLIVLSDKYISVRFPLVKLILIISLLVFPFVNNHSSIYWKRDLNLHPKQTEAKAIVNHLKTNNIAYNRIIYADPYLAIPLNIDPFDENKRLNLTKLGLSLAKPRDVIIWDKWFSEFENNVTPNDILAAHADLIAELGDYKVYFKK